MTASAQDGTTAPMEGRERERVQERERVCVSDGGRLNNGHSYLRACSLHGALQILKLPKSDKTLGCRLHEQFTPSWEEKHGLGA